MIHGVAKQLGVSWDEAEAAAVEAEALGWLMMEGRHSVCLTEAGRQLESFGREESRRELRGLVLGDPNLPIRWRGSAIAQLGRATFPASDHSIYELQWIRSCRCITQRAAAARHLARQAIRLATSQASESEKQQLTRYAEELDAKAAALERCGEEGGKGVDCPRQPVGKWL